MKKYDMWIMLYNNGTWTHYIHYKPIEAKSLENAFSCYLVLMKEALSRTSAYVISVSYTNSEIVAFIFMKCGFHKIISLKVSEFKDPHIC